MEMERLTESPGLISRDFLKKELTALPTKEKAMWGPRSSIRLQ